MGRVARYPLGMSQTPSSPDRGPDRAEGNWDDTSQVAPVFDQAAIAVWISSAVILVIFGCCAALLAAVGLTPPGELQEALAEQMPPEQMELLLRIQPMLRVAAVLVFLIMFLPALLMLFAGFKIRQRSEA